MEWISVSDKLPEPNQWVLIDWHGDPDLVQFVTTSDGDYFWDNNHKSKRSNIIYQSTEIDYWCPRPDPPVKKLVES